MSREKERPDWDDGRTIASMEGIEGPSLFRSAPERTDGQKPPENSYSGRERRWAILGALKAALLIALVFLAGLALVIAALLLIWNGRIA